ncbi:diguanylate phosphodiesterase [Alsobacter metallidurans]|uniref:Diguanylate phosphodiesterase n=1 Tax=Alsobacter metallidurans TaxID=340221 RepID=A0A917MGY2_9HYPH|nr:diguanylate phosphodiesterase [Alsobacter metallidurans]
MGQHQPGIRSAVTSRFEPIAIFAGVVILAVASALTLWSGLGLSWPVSALAGMGVAVALLAIAAWSRRGAAPAPINTSEVAAVLEELAATRERLAAVEERMGVLDRAMVEYSRKTVTAVANELDMVGSVVRDLAQAVAMHDAELFARTDGPNLPADASAADVARSAFQAPPEAVRAAEADPQAEPPAPRPGQSREDRNVVARAITQERLDLFLQPIMAAPHRRVTLYETMARVRLPSGAFVEMPDVAAVAQQRGLAAQFDAYLLANVVKIARHLLGRGRDVPILCGLTTRALVDQTFFQALTALGAAERELVGRIVFQFPLADVRAFGVLELEGLEAIRELGFRFAVSGVSDLKLDARPLFERGFRFVSVPAELLLAAQSGAVPTDIHPADLAGLMARHGLALIVEGVDADDVMIDLADFSVALARGDIFGAPRPVRADVLAERPAAEGRPSPEPQAGPATQAAPATQAFRPEPVSAAARARTAATPQPRTETVMPPPDSALAALVRELGASRSAPQPQQSAPAEPAATDPAATGDGLRQSLRSFLKNGAGR